MPVNLNAATQMFALNKNVFCPGGLEIFLNKVCCKEGGGGEGGEVVQPCG